MKLLLAWAALLLAAPAVAQTGGDMTPNTVDIVETASAAGKFDTLLKAVREAGITEQLAQARNVTLLAPIDPAFQGVKNLPALLSDKAKLKSVLEYHVIPSTYLSKDIPQGDTSVTTLGGQKLTIRNRGGSVSVITPSGVEAMVVQADIKSDAGVVHAINKVLLPWGLRAGRPLRG